MRRLRRVVATVTTVAVLGLSAACGGDNPTPSTAPSTSPSPSSSETETRSVPELPEAATKPGRQGAAAFVRYWVAVLNYAGQTGDTGPLRNLSTTDCVKCAALYNGITKVYDAGGQITGGGWTVLSTKQYGPTQNRFFVDATIRSEKQSLTPSEGASPSDFPGVPKRLRAFVLRPTDDGWQVAELDPTA